MLACGFITAHVRMRIFNTSYEETNRITAQLIMSKYVDVLGTGNKLYIIQRVDTKWLINMSMISWVCTMLFEKIQNSNSDSRYRYRADKSQGVRLKWVWKAIVCDEDRIGYLTKIGLEIWMKKKKLEM